MNDFKVELESIEKVIDTNKLEKARLEERLKKLGEDKQEILTKLKEENIKEDELESVVIDMEMEIQEQLDKAKEELK
ncbi:hypothetical protein LCGC14_1748120 [marine sediment metagenome]|uniref:Uncharacterized protein n=1 Tax=marine sediment metagenome TaxID=412755 RepID=A0A0F9H4Q2_9ZZZZ